MNTTAVTAGQEQTAEEQMTAISEEDDGLSLEQFTEWLTEIDQQPAWRARADREADYYDGNQLDSEVLQRQRAIGMPPAIEPLIGPTIDSVLGMEAKTRTDWRVIPDGDKEGDEVAEALNYKLNQAERHSKADNACSEAYASQIKVGLGWLEVSRDSDPFGYPYRCEAIHRNEIFWDMLARPDMSNARYLVRRKWTDKKQAKLKFPQHADLIESAVSGWSGFDPYNMTHDGGSSTDLSMAWMMERGWSIEEQQWRDMTRKRVCLFEVWYRVWERVLVLKAPDGRTVEYDWNNPMHVEAVAVGAIVPQYAVVGKMRMAWFMGPHRLHDDKTPYRHQKFPYVPFWGKKEDRTGVPYGLIRGMMYLQDEVNARISKMQWGLAAVRTTRTDGAVLDDDEVFRQEIARPDADIKLSHDKMKNGGVFKVERDFELNRQQYERLIDAREGIKRTGGVNSAFSGQDTATGNSGVANAGLIEQSTQTLADINDNFKFARAEVGDLLLSLVIEDMIGKEETILIDGQSIKDDREITVNTRTVDPETGVSYLNNDVERTKLKVTLDDVPSSPSFRTQQLAAMSEAFKSAPPDYQKVMMPHLFSLMDVPNKKDIIQAIKDSDQGQQSPEQIQAQIDEAVQQALTKAGMEWKMRELDQKQALVDAQVRKLDSESVNKSVEGMFSATQAANQIAMVPSVAGMADAMLLSAGFKDANIAPIVPSVPPGVQPIAMAENTNPLTPTNPGVGADAGIEGGRQGFARGGIVGKVIDGVENFGRTTGEYWARDNAEFDQGNPSAVARVARVIAPNTGLGSAVGAMHKAAGIGDHLGMASALLSAAPTQGAMTKTLSPAIGASKELVKTLTNNFLRTGADVAGNVVVGEIDDRIQNRKR